MTTEIKSAPAHQRPSGKMYLGTDQLNLVDDAITLVELDTIPAGFTDGIENTTSHRITPGVAGFYNIIGQVTFFNIVTPKRYRAAIKISGSTWVCWNYSEASVGAYLSVPVATQVKLSATDYIELYARSRADADTVDLKGGLQRNFLGVQRVR